MLIQEEKKVLIYSVYFRSLINSFNYASGKFCKVIIILELFMVCYNESFFLPPANEVWGKVVFLHLCVILFTGGGGLPISLVGRPEGGWEASGCRPPQGRIPLDADPLGRPYWVKPWWRPP